MTIERRHFLIGLGAGSAATLMSSLARANEGMINARADGFLPNRETNQGKILQTILEKASRERKPVFIEPGQYQIADVRLPVFTSLHAVPGTVTFNYANGKHFVMAEGGANIHIEGLMFDGKNQPQAQHAESCIHIQQTQNVIIEDCEITNANNIGLAVFGSSGRITGNRVSKARGECGILGTNNDAMAISNNVVRECDNGGIVVSRWERGADNTIISGNRIIGIEARKGGTGQWGNGINTYQADGVLIANNHVSSCALSAIRANSCSNVQIIGNTCFGSGETGIYSEFAFQGANISNNLIDGGAIGISVANFNEGGRISSVTGNIIRNIGDEIPYENPEQFYGIGISVEADTVVSANVIDSVKNFGMFFGWGPYLRNVIASNNVIRDAGNGIYLSVVEGIGQVLISDNIMSSIKGLGIAGYRWHDRVTKELVDRDGIHLDVVSISGNRLDK